MYNAYIDGLIKGGNIEWALEIFQRMKKDRCKPSTDTYTMIINLYGKVEFNEQIKLNFLFLFENNKFTHYNSGEAISYVVKDFQRHEI